MADLSLVRRLEAVSFQSFPAGSTYYNGTWAVRLTKNHTARRLNSINALDPRDTHDLGNRLDEVGFKFGQYGKPLVFRKSPLMPEKLFGIFVERGWREFDETIIMTRSLADFDCSKQPEVLPQSDVAKWVDAAIELGEEKKINRSRLIEILQTMKLPTGLFLLPDEMGRAACVGRCVVHGDMVGLFEMATRKDLRNRGLAKKLVNSALQFGRVNKAVTGWLQVVATNDPAVQLYTAAGFGERYRYSYWTPDSI